MRWQGRHSDPKPSAAPKRVTTHFPSRTHGNCWAHNSINEATFHFSSSGDQAEYRPERDHASPLARISLFGPLLIDGRHQSQSPYIGLLKLSASNKSRESLANDMSRYSRLGPFMDANVFRSASNAQYQVDPNLLSPRYATLGSSRRGDYFRDPLERHYSDPHTDAIYRSARHYDEQYSASGRDLVDLVRKTNQNASVSNAAIRSVTRDTLIQPRVCVDGRYPTDFPTPMRLSDLMALPESQLHRLLDDYDIPTHGHFDLGRRHHEQMFGFDAESARQGQVSKLVALLDYLGASQIADVLCSGSGGGSLHAPDHS
ncbi:hypothetical protein Q7P37_003553 [Cladosporium fusiforme]